MLQWNAALGNDYDLGTVYENFVQFYYQIMLFYNFRVICVSIVYILYFVVF